MLWTCSHGHRWEASVEDDNTEAAVLCCPVCGTPTPSASQAKSLDCEVADELPPPPGWPRIRSPSPPVGASDWPSLPGYEILEELGRGGMGIVYKARQLNLNRIVALKMIATAAHAERERNRFRAEAEAVAQLQHANIVHIYEVGEHAGRPYLALEFAEGGNLHQRLGGTPLPPRTAAQLVETLAKAVHYAHQRGIIHRDLKPANFSW